MKLENRLANVEEKLSALSEVIDEVTIEDSVVLVLLTELISILHERDPDMVKELVKRLATQAEIHVEEDTGHALNDLISRLRSRYNKG